MTPTNKIIYFLNQLAKCFLKSLYEENFLLDYLNTAKKKTEKGEKVN